MDSQERRYAKYLEIARATKAFNEAEIGVLEEVLQDCLVEQSEEGYILLAEQDKGEDVAFLIYGKTPMTEFTYDLYWIVVSPSYQGKGIGRRLVNRMESLILAKREKANIRLETSGSKAYSGQRSFYEALGFRVCGRIPSFYREGDDLVTFYKFISKNNPSGGKEGNERL